MSKESHTDRLVDSYPALLPPNLFVATSPCLPWGPTQIGAVADERGLYRYVIQSFKVFEQAIFAKACEKSATGGGGRLGDDEPCEDGNGSSNRGYPHRNGLLAETAAEAMVAGLKESNIIEFEALEEAVER